MSYDNYRLPANVADATLLYLARVYDMKLVTCDQAVAAICPGNKNLELLTP
jgi:predicted nucleic acid-binding protein